MKKGPDPQQQLKIKIFETYRNCISALSPDIFSKHSDQLCSLIQEWCKKYFFTAEETNETSDGECVSSVVEKMVKKDRTIKTYANFDEFFIYLKYEMMKLKMFNTYKSYINVPSPDILAKYKGQLWSLIDRWSKKYMFKEEWDKEAVEAMVEYIPDVIDKLVKKSYENPGKFITYLEDCLKTEKTKTFYKLLPEKVVKARVKKYFWINRLIETRERDGKLTENDRIEKIEFYMPIARYIEIRDNVLHLQNLEDKKQQDDEGKDIDPLNFPNVRSVFNNDSEIIDKPENNRKLKEVFDSVFAGIKEGKKPFYRALVTAQFLDVTPDIEWFYENFEWIHEYLDSDILKKFKEDGTKPTDKEIYKIFYPTTNNPSESVSGRLGEFRDNLEAMLNEKDLRIFFRKH